MRKKERKIEFSASGLSYVKVWLCSENMEEINATRALFEKGVNIIEQKISYLNYLRLATEVENFKKLFLTTEHGLISFPSHD